MSSGPITYAIHHYLTLLNQIKNSGFALCITRSGVIECNPSDILLISQPFSLSFKKFVLITHTLTWTSQTQNGIRIFGYPEFAEPFIYQLRANAEQLAKDNGVKQSLLRNLTFTRKIW